MKGDAAKWRSVVADERRILREAEVFHMARKRSSSNRVLDASPSHSSPRSRAPLLGAPVTPSAVYRSGLAPAYASPPSTPTDVDIEPSQRPARHKGSAYAHASPANGMCRRRRRIASHLECHQLFGPRCTVPTVPSISDADFQQRPDSRNPIGRCAHPEQRSTVPSQVVWPAGLLPVNPKVHTTRACVPHEALQCGLRHSFHLIVPAP